MEVLKLWVTSSLIGVKNPFHFFPLVVTWHVSTSSVHGRVHACAWCCRHNVPYLDYEQLVLNSNKEGMDFLRKGQYKQGPVCHVCHLTQGLTESWQLCYGMFFLHIQMKSKNQEIKRWILEWQVVTFSIDICDRFGATKKRFNLCQLRFLSCLWPMTWMMSLIILSSHNTIVNLRP